MKLSSPRLHSRRAFSLIELLVSIAVLSLIMLMVFQMLERTQATWKKSRDSVSEYKDARVAFEAITRRLSQATLNTFWAYSKSTTNVATQFERSSDLHFVSGLATDIMGTTLPPNSGPRTTHCMFFQAPTGYSETKDTNNEMLKYGAFPNLLNSWGYFVEFGTDLPDRPAFISGLDNPPRTRARFRLVEYCQPTEGLQIYAEQLRDPAKKTLAPTNLYRWFLNNQKYGTNSPFNYPAGNDSSDSLQNRTNRIVAENIIALIVLPTESQTEELRDDLAPNYHYDSRSWQSSISSKSGSSLNVQKSRNALPPIVEITMVAVDEADFNRYALSQQIDSVSGYAKCNFTEGLFTKSADYNKDLDTLNTVLTNKTPEIKYRVFRASVRLREAKWGGFVDANTSGGTN